MDNMKFVLLVLLLRSFVECGQHRIKARANNANEAPATNTPTFVTEPMNITVSRGQTAVLPCKVKDLSPFLVVWRREKDKYILYAGDFKITKDARFRIQENMTALVIDSVTSEDSSEYTCQVGTVPPKEITHRLTVIETTASSAFSGAHRSLLQLLALIALVQLTIHF